MIGDRIERPFLLEECSAPRANIRRELEHGGTVASAETSPPSARVEALFNCPAEHIWRLLHDYERLPQLIAGLDTAEVLDRGNGDATVAFTVKLPFPIGRIRWVNRVSYRRYRGTFGISWSLVSGNLLESAGRLLMAPYDGDPQRTYANYRIQVQTRARLPQSAQRLATRWLLPRIVKHLRTIAENGPQTVGRTQQRVFASSPLELIWAVASGRPAEVAWRLDDHEEQALRSALESHWPSAKIRGLKPGGDQSL